jgi:hypothetical protein
MVETFIAVSASSGCGGSTSAVAPDLLRAATDSFDDAVGRMRPHHVG